jgi:hypothetical protein
MRIPSSPPASASQDMQQIAVPAALTPHNAAAETVFAADSGRAGAAALKHLLVSLGLPADKLSASIVSFARFFSLPLDSSLLAKIRRQALVPQQPASLPDGEPRAAAVREALSFAAAAAASKGVELGKQGLEHYAAALQAGMESEAAPAAENAAEAALLPADPDGGQHSNPQDHEAPHSDLFEQRHSAEPDSGETELAAACGAAELKEKFLAAAEGDPLLELLNRMPDKNGRRWIVLPLRFNSGGNAWHLSLRLLLDDAGNIAGEAAGGGHISLEIVKQPKQGEKTQRRWLFAADCAGAKGIANGSFQQEMQNLTVCVQPPPKKGSLLITRLAQGLKIAPAKIFLKKNADFSSFEAEMCQKDLLFVNKEV